VNNPIRKNMMQAMWSIIALEHGCALDCAPLSDPDQKRVLLSAKASLQKALDLEGQQPAPSSTLAKLGERKEEAVL
jgi:hypothetical protein